jgi:hypothetical protein
MIFSVNVSLIFRGLTFSTMPFDRETITQTGREETIAAIQIKSCLLRVPQYSVGF